jgi:hypothetical protein
VSFIGDLKRLQEALGMIRADPASEDPERAVTLDQLFGIYQVRLRADCSQAKERDDAAPGDQPESRPEPDADHPDVKPGVYDGLVVSASRACRIRAWQRRPGDAPDKTQQVKLADSRFWVQDSRYLTILPTSRGFLVTRAAQYNFAGGQATGITDNRPSEALAVVSLPGTIVGGLISGVTSVFTNQSAVTNAQAGVIAAQTSLLNDQASLLAAQTALAKAKAAPPD